MRVGFGLALGLALGLTAVGCGPKISYDGPTVDKFHGRVAHEGKPVSFPAGEQVFVELFHEKAQSFKIPIESDGTFKIGWMPIGKYSATLIRGGSGAKAGPNRYNIPGGLTIVDGQTDYTIELGKGWKP